MSNQTTWWLLQLKSLSDDGRPIYQYANTTTTDPRRATKYRTRHRAEWARETYEGLEDYLVVGHVFTDQDAVS